MLIRTRMYRRMGYLQRQSHRREERRLWCVELIVAQHAFHFHCISRWLKTRHGVSLSPDH